MSVLISVAVDCSRVHILLLTGIKGVRLLVHFLHIAVYLAAFLNLVILLRAATLL